MKKFLLASLIALFFGQISGQTLFSENFDGALGVSTTGGALYSNSSGSGDRPASSPFYVSSNRGYGVSNGNSTIESPTLDASMSTTATLTLRLAAFSISSTTNGMDNGDYALVSVSDDNGGTWYDVLQVKGSTANNAHWSYSNGTGMASTTYQTSGTPAVFQPTTSGSQTTNGFSTLTVTDLPTSIQLKVKVYLLNNSANERWVIDDLIVTGGCTGPATPASNLVFPTINNISAVVQFDRGDGDGVLVVMKSGSAPATDPSSGTTYNADPNFGDGDEIGTATQIYAIYNDIGNSVAVTGLTAATTYYIAIYEYSTASGSPCYNTDELTGSFTTTAVATLPFSRIGTSSGSSEWFANTQTGWTDTGFETPYADGSARLRDQNDQSKVCYDDVSADCSYQIVPKYSPANTGGEVRIEESPDNSTWFLVRVIDLLDLPFEGKYFVDNLTFSTRCVRWTFYLKNLGTNFGLNYVNFPADPAVSLPVELLKFYLRKTPGHSVGLFWETASEQNADRFVVERSADGREFSDIGQTPAAGNSTEIRRYLFSDNRPLPGRNFYRLRQLDFDGSAHFGPVREINFDGKNGFRLENTLVRSALQIANDDPNAAAATWEIFDGRGASVLRGSVEAETERWQVLVPDLPPGIWFLKVESERERGVFRFVKID